MSGISSVYLIGMKSMLSVLKGNTLDTPPIWLMRQAGRYLPEYKETRKQAGSFLDLCYNPELAAEVTLQPIRKFGFDAAILFADILLIPDALGQMVAFKEGVGPILEPINVDELKAGRMDDKLHKVYETVSILKKELPEETTLIGFAGAPWTVMTYMIEGGTDKSREYRRTSTYILTNPQKADHLLLILVEATAHYLIQQIEHGAEVVQLFDSWAGAVKGPWRESLVYEPTRKIVNRVKEVHPDVPIIGFPRGIGNEYADYIKHTGVDAVGLDEGISLEKASMIQELCPVQGNLSSELLADDLDAALKQTDLILESLNRKPFIFNLGHGILPHTPEAHVHALIEKIRK